MEKYLNSKPDPRELISQSGCSVKDREIPGPSLPKWEQPLSIQKISGKLSKSPRNLRRFILGD